MTYILNVIVLLKVSLADFQLKLYASQNNVADLRKKVFEFHTSMLVTKPLTATNINSLHNSFDAEVSSHECWPSAS